MGLTLTGGTFTGCQWSVSAAPPSFTPDAVKFDGIGDWSRQTSLGASDTSKGIFNCWFLIPNSTGQDFVIFWAKTTSTNKLLFWKDDGDQHFRWILRNVAGTAKWAGETTTTVDYGDWHHILMSWDFTTGAGDFYLDDVSSFTEATAPASDSSTLEWSLSNATNGWSLGTEGNGARLGEGEMAEVYAENQTYLPLATESNRRLFISATGKPVDLGATGTIPTGVQPLVYSTGDATAINNGDNAGSGGPFVMTGAVADSANEPVELP